MEEIHVRRGNGGAAGRGPSARRCAPAGSATRCSSPCPVAGERWRRSGATGTEPPPVRRPPMRTQDVLGTLRFLRKQPLLAGAIVGMLALGIGATTALWSVVYGVLLKPLPFPDADRIVEVWGAKPSRAWDRVAHRSELLGYGGHESRLCRVWRVARRQRDSSRRRGSGAGDGGVRQSGFFRSLGVQPVAGRLFSPADTRRAIASASRCCRTRSGCGATAGIPRSSARRSRWAADPAR